MIGRRAALRVLGLLGAGFVVWSVQEILLALIAPSGSGRRFTGTKGRQEERRMLDSYKKREYQGGQEWRAACLQARQGEASPARFLTYRIVQGVD